MNLINWNILSSPANWIIIFLVLYIAVLVTHVLFQASQQGSTLQLPGL